MIAISAVDKNWAIGNQGQLLISLPEDQKGVFKKYTAGHTVVYGRKTIETFPGQRLLPNRVNVIMSRSFDYEKEGAMVLHSVDELQDFLDLTADEGLPYRRSFTLQLSYRPLRQGDNYKHTG